MIKMNEKQMNGFIESKTSAYRIGVLNQRMGNRQQAGGNGSKLDLNGFSAETFERSVAIERLERFKRSAHRRSKPWPKDKIRISLRS